MTKSYKKIADQMFELVEALIKRLNRTMMNIDIESITEDNMITINKTINAGVYQMTGDESFITGKNKNITITKEKFIEYLSESKDMIENKIKMKEIYQFISDKINDEEKALKYKAWTDKMLLTTFMTTKITFEISKLLGKKGHKELAELFDELKN